MPIPAALSALLGELGIDARQARVIVARLCESPATLAELVQISTAPRRTVQAVLAACGKDLVGEGDGPFSLRQEACAGYREVVSRLDELTSLVASAPVVRPALDQVPATVETVLRRALWLRSRFDLKGTDVLCLGDHDLTSLAIAAVVPSTRVWVVDVDERLLAFVGGESRRRRVEVRTLFADLREGLPATLTGRVDLVLTDPPYTPQGVGLFAERALLALRDRRRGRVIIAYGYADTHPGLGLAVQDRLHRLRLVLETVLPAFNRYQGAQAIGSASDLYVCRPTTRTWKVLGAASRGPAGIYTHGPTAADEQLLRTLLAAGGEVEVVVRSGHPDLRDARSRAALQRLVAPRWQLSFRRSAAGVTVVATPTPADALGPDDLLARHILERNEGKVGNTWRESLTRYQGLTRNEARAVIAGSAVPDWVLGITLAHLPRHLIAEVLTATRGPRPPR